MTKAKSIPFWEKREWKRRREAIARKLPISFLQTTGTLALLVVVLWAIIRFFMTASWRHILGYLVFLAFILLLIVLSIKSKRAERVIEGAFNYNWLFAKWMFISLTPIYFFYLVVAPLITKAPRTWLRWLAIVVGGLLLTGGSLAVSTEKLRERVLPWLQQRVGRFAPVVYSADLLTMAILFFSSVSYALVSNGHLHLADPRQATISADSIQQFYFWHFLEAIPLLKINETLQWPAPLAYKGVVGLLLLLFQLMVIVPVIATFVWYWKRVEPRRKRLRRKRRLSSRLYF